MYHFGIATTPSQFFFVRCLARFGFSNFAMQPSFPRKTEKRVVVPYTFRTCSVPFSTISVVPYSVLAHILSIYFLKLYKQPENKYQTRTCDSLAKMVGFRSALCCAVLLCTALSCCKIVGAMVTDDLLGPGGAVADQVFGPGGALTDRLTALSVVRNTDIQWYIA